MKDFNSLAKQVSDYHSKGSPKKSEAHSTPSPSSPKSDAAQAMHESLEGVICPGCHDKVKELMHKHGISPESGKEGEQPVSEMNR